MDLYLVRHGDYQNTDNIIPLHLPVPLSSQGIQQSQKLGRYFIGKNISHLFASPIKRTQQTAEIISKFIHTPIVTLDHFTELTNPQLQGQPRGELDFCLFTIEGGESVDLILERMKHGLEVVLSTTTKHAIIVSHGDPITILYHYLINQPIPTTPVHNQSCFIQKGQIFKITFVDKKVQDWEKITL